jgi:hypothetical protein
MISRIMQTEVNVIFPKPNADNIVRGLNNSGYPVYGESHNCFIIHSIDYRFDFFGWK